MKRLFLFLLLLCSLSLSRAQQRLQLKLHDAPENKSFILQLLAFNTNGFEIIDSLIVDSSLLAKSGVDSLVYFEIPDQLPAGLMQLKIPGDINQSEFIFNPNEKIILEASYWGLKNGDIITEHSNENAAYSDLLKLQQQYEQLLTQLVEEKKLLTPFQPNYRTSWGIIESRIERLQQELNNKLLLIEERYPNTFTVDVLVRLTKVPVRTAEQMKEFDGYLAFLNQHFFDYVDFNDNRLLRHYAFVDKIFYYLTTYTQKTENGTKRGLDYILSVFGNNEAINSLVFNNLLQTFIELDNEIFTLYLLENSTQGCALNLDYQDLKRLQNIQALSVGGTAPDLLLYDHKRDAQSLRSYTRKNKITIVYIWISWCAHCQKTTPELLNLYNNYKSKGLGVFAVSLDENEADWIEAIHSYQTDWINTAELVPIKQSKVAPLYKVSTTPSLYILDGEGKVLAKNIYGDKLDKWLSEKFDDM